MARTTKIMSISLPPKLAFQIDQFCKKTEFTKSELFRNAFRNYLESWKETRVVKREFPHIVREAKEARKNFQKGDYISLEKVIKKQGYVQHRSRSHSGERSS